MWNRYWIYKISVIWMFKQDLCNVNTIWHTNTNGGNFKTLLNEELSTINEGWKKNSVFFRYPTIMPSSARAHTHTHTCKHKHRHTQTHTQIDTHIHTYAHIWKHRERQAHIEIDRLITNKICSLTCMCVTVMKKSWIWEGIGSHGRVEGVRG